MTHKEGGNFFAFFRNKSAKSVRRQWSEISEISNEFAPSFFRIRRTSDHEADSNFCIWATLSNWPQVSKNQS